VQNQVILSIGSNIGDRLQIIEKSIEMLHHEVGTVIKTSRLYESASWGFVSENFYNCVVLIHSEKSAKQILSNIQKIEKTLGRVKTSVNYEARTIDIDIIDFNNGIIDSKNLQIPHLQMQNRLFVLLPIKDLEIDYCHPVLNKKIGDLIVDCTDTSDCKFISKLQAPLNEVRLNQFNYIAIEGNIGAGKTTLASKIAEDFNAKIILEGFADNPFLPKFYKDQNRYAFPLEMSFLADRYQQLSGDLAQFDLFKDFIVADYHIFKSLIFAKVTLQSDEYRLYKTLFDIIYKEMPKPDLYVYLYQNTARLLQNIKLRGRSYEKEIHADYLDKINNGYLDYIKSQTGLNVLIIDVSDRDFVKKQSDYLYIIDQIKSKIA
jgi:2-amino-4-hydroxy-6-hydroxymethyldihydropteridine diphosphokinase